MSLNTEHAIKIEKNEFDSDLEANSESDIKDHEGADNSNLDIKLQNELSNEKIKVSRKSRKPWS